MEFTQQPDTKPGPYFVSAIDGTKKYLMAGPFDLHVEALAVVDKAKNISCDHDPRAWFMSWGTCRIEGSQSIGALNKHNLI